MSTRSHIAFYADQDDKLEDFQALLYRHSDGYPSGVLPDIMPFLAWWITARGIEDIEYCSARLLQYLANNYDESSVRFLIESEKRGSASAKEELAEIQQFTGILGHGISKQFHWDIEYLYAITPQGVTVFEAGFPDEKLKAHKIGFIPYAAFATSPDYIKLTKREDSSVLPL